MHITLSGYVRTKIEGIHSHEVEQLRKRYSMEQKELITGSLEAKERSESLAQEPVEKGQLGKLNSLFLSPSPSPSLITYKIVLQILRGSYQV